MRPPGRPCARRNSTGFSLVEMLAVSALTALLTLAAFELVAALAKAQRAMPAPVSQERWLDVVQRDLQGAEMTKLGAQPVLLGNLCLDANGAATHLPARVEYAVEAIASRNWLVRKQTALSDRGDGPTVRELLAPDMSAIDFSPASVSRDTKVLQQVRITVEHDKGGGSERTVTVR